MDVNRSITDTAFPPHDIELVTLYSYNSLNKKLSRLSPDGGRTLYAYDQLGRAVLTQDAVLRERNEANYVKYDLQGRLVEGGNVQLFNNLNTIMDEGKIKYAAFRSELDDRATIKNDYVVTSFDRPTEERAVLSKFENSQQSNLRNRISSVKYYGTGTNLQHAIYFDYDVAGNMKEIVQDFANLQSVTELNSELATHHRFKSIRYKYNIFTGKVNQIAYQEGNSDQFYRWYVYDANQQIIAVKTGFNKWEPEIYKDIDVKYQYYMHGPIAQSIFGMENIQSFDLAYTINSWLKNVNHNITQESNCLPDVLDYSLEYFQGDYKGISDPVTTSFSGVQLYSGNISGIKIFNRGLDTDIRTHQYKYDQLNRLVQSRTNNLDAYRMDLTYDKNGNIQTLDRYDGSSSRFDQLTYRYDTRKKNRLLFIEDDARQRLPEPMKDLTNQSPNNYQYDAKGRLIRDASEGNMSLQWDATDKLRQMVNEAGTNNMFYDAMGRRTIKKIRPQDGHIESEFTVRDFAGNIFAEYSVNTRGVILKSIPIYSDSRIASIDMDTSVGATFQNRWCQYRGKKLYELKNQIGDINVLVTDRKIPDAADYKVDIKKATEYYPFGMIMPGRDSARYTYRYGFQGMEQDDNFKGKGNSISTEFRQYDPRVARWLSVDPMLDKYPNFSPYIGMNNNAVNVIDKLGLEGEDEVTGALNNLTMKTAELHAIEQREGVYVGQTLKILRFDEESGINRIYQVTAGQIMPLNTSAPMEGVQGYEGPRTEEFVNANQVAEEIHTALTEVALAELELTRHTINFMLNNDFNLSDRQRQELLDQSTALRGIHILSEAYSIYQDYNNLNSALTSMASRDPSDLSGRLSDFSEIFDVAIHTASRLGIPIPPYLNDGFVENYGQTIFIHHFQLERIMQSPEIREENCYTAQGCNYIFLNGSFYRSSSSR